MQRILLILLTTIALVPGAAKAQTPQWSWAKDVGSISFDSGNSIALDASGNVITVGTFADTADFDPGPNTFPLVARAGDFFVLKLNSSGNLEWAEAFGDSLNDVATAVVTDSYGNIYVTGHISGVVDFNPDTQQVLNLGVTGTIQAFLLKLNPDGTLAWAHCSTGSGNCASTDLRLDNSGYLVFSGSVSGQIDVDADSTTQNTINLSSSAVFIARVDTSGIFDWVHTITGGVWSPGPFLAVDSNDNIWITGTFHDTCDFDPGDTSYFYLTAQSLDVYLVKLSAQGNFLFADKFGNILDQRAYAIDCDGYNNVYLIGNFNGVVDFDPDPVNVYTLSTTAHWTVFMVKLNSSGTFHWAGKVGGNTNDAIFCHGADVDYFGNLYITGYYEHTIDFDPDPVGQSIASSIFDSEDIFISGYDADGNFLFKEVPVGAGDETGNAIAVDGNGKLMFTGASASTFYMGPFQLVNAGSYAPLVYPTDIIVAQMEDIPVGLIGSIPETHLGVFPNPADASISIEMEQANSTSQVVISDIFGKSLIQTSIISHQQTIDISKLPCGVYILRIEEDNQLHIAKFVISR